MFNTDPIFNKQWDDEWFPEEMPLSLCIAATCKNNDGPCVVHCVDYAGTRGDVRSEDIIKIKDVGPSTVLLAGNMGHARELLATCRRHIEAFPLRGNDLAITKLRQGLTEAVRERKRSLATETLAGDFAVSYDELFNFSQEHPDDPRWMDAWRIVRALNLGAELIVSTFTDDEVALLTIEASGRIVWTDHYAAVGTGSSIAAPFLHQRDYDDAMDVSECIYRVMEAKIAAEKNPHVGRKTNIEVRTPKIMYFVSKEYIDRVRTIIEGKRVIATVQIEMTDLDEAGTAEISAAIEKANAISSGQ